MRGDPGFACKDLIVLMEGRSILRAREKLALRGSESRREVTYMVDGRTCQHGDCSERARTSAQK